MDHYDLIVRNATIIDGTRAKDGNPHGNARAVTMAATGEKLGAGSSEGAEAGAR